MGRLGSTLFLLSLAACGFALLAFVISRPSPGDREAQAAISVKQGLEEARRASLRAQGLPDFIPETKSDWARFCQGWPDHSGCVILRDVGFPFSRESVANQCGWEKRELEKGILHKRGDTSGAKLEWYLYDESLTPAVICAAYGLKLEE